MIRVIRVSRTIGMRAGESGWERVKQTSRTSSSSSLKLLSVKDVKSGKSDASFGDVCTVIEGADDSVSCRADDPSCSF